MYIIIGANSRKTHTTKTTSSLSFRSGIVEENEQASGREIACRVETLRACRAASVVSETALSTHTTQVLIGFGVTSGWS